MKDFFYRAVIVFFFLFSPYTLAAKKALIIGNNAYQGGLSYLNNPISDAKTIRAALENIGFSIADKDFVVDVDKKKFDAALEDFTSRLTPEDIAFIYFAGHGVAFNGENYLLPTSMTSTDPAVLPYDAIPAQKILDWVSSKSRHTIFVLDACRETAISRSAKTRGLAPMHTALGGGSYYILYAAQAGTVAYDNSGFAKALAREIQKPQSLENIRLNVLRAVRKATANQQTPNVTNQLDAPLFLVENAAGGEIAPTTPLVLENVTPTLGTTPYWVKKIWRWADEFEIPEEEIPRQLDDLLSMKRLEIERCTHETCSNNPQYKFRNRRKITYLPPEIFNLRQLTVFNLIGNRLSVLPPEIGNLTQLKTLLIWDNQLNSLPSEIGNLKLLEDLQVGINQLHNLPPEIGNLRNLKTLSVGGNSLPFLPSWIGDLTQLEILNIFDNQLHDLPPEIGNLRNLKKLDISETNLQSLPASIGNLTQLEKLYIWDNQLHDLPPEIGHLRNLKELSISKNNLQSLPASIGNLTQLEILYIWGNPLRSLPSSFANLRNLRILDMVRLPNLKLTPEQERFIKNIPTVYRR